MNLLGLQITFNKNGKYVKHNDCPVKHQEIKDIFCREIINLKEHFDTRINDLKDFLLRNGR